jgi:hypothetical protein
MHYCLSQQTCVTMRRVGVRQQVTSQAPPNHLYPDINNHVVQNRNSGPVIFSVAPLSRYVEHWVETLIEDGHVFLEAKWFLTCIQCKEKVCRLCVFDAKEVDVTKFYVYVVDAASKSKSIRSIILPNCAITSHHRQFKVHHLQHHQLVAEIIITMLTMLSFLHRLPLNFNFNVQVPQRQSQ